MTAHGDTTISRDELRHATLASVRWVTVVRVVAETIGLASTVVLARLLTPAEFGRAALTLILFEIAYSLANEGFGTPLVQRAAIDSGHIRTALALALALGAFAGTRSERLARDRRALVAHTMSQFTHGARNDLSALRNLADLTLDGAITDTQAAREAIDDTFAQARDSLRLVSLQARAAVPEGGRTRKLRQALRQLAPAAERITPPAGAVALPLEDGVLMELLAVPVAALGGQVDRVLVAEHIDGWAVEFERAGAARGTRRVAWVEVRGQVPLGLVALACNLLGGRTWADVDDRDRAGRLGLTLPAA